MHVPNLHAAVIGKFILIWKSTNSQDVLKGLDSTKFLEVLKRN